METVKKPLISIVILVKEDPHLLHLTFESLVSQEVKNFEVIVLDRRGSRSPIGLFSELPFLLEEAKEGPISEVMNQGLLLAQGTYVQFLFPGDRFLSQQATAYLSELAESSHFPTVIYCAFILRDPDLAPRAEAKPLHLELLRKGMSPTLPRSYWFLKSAIQGRGFTLECHHRPAFDLLCTLMADQSTRVVYTRRVLADYEWRRKKAGEMVGYAMETCHILYRHFGAWHALRWLFVQDHVRMWRWTWKLIKQAFVKNG
jgi:hypothetical protein